MGAFATSIPAKSLDDFCAQFVSHHKESWPPAEGTLAREFAEQFQPKFLSPSEHIVEFASRLRIGVSFKALPDGMHGLNCSTEEETLVCLNDPEAFSGSREHTFFHELREIIEYRFRDLGFPTAQGLELERRAEQFATEVRIASLMKELGALFENAQAIEQTWKRWLAFAGVLVLALGMGAGCFLLPHFEENFPRSKSR